MKDIYAIEHSDRLAAVTRYYDMSPDAVTRNLTQEMQQTAAGYRATAPDYLALHQEYDPQYQALDLDTQRQRLYGFDDAEGVHHPGTLEMGRTGATYQRGGDIADVLNMGPAAFAAFLQANPLLAKSLINLSGRTEDSPILQRLNADAMAGLESGGQLSPQEIRALEQQSRGGFADRGNFRGNQSMVSEFMSRDAATRQRQQQAQQLAMGVQGLNMNQADLVGRASQIFGSQFDPFLSVISRPSNASGGGAGGGPAGMIGTGAKMFDPFNPYVQDIFSSNANAQSASNIAGANNNAALIAGGLSLAGAVLSDKRLKTGIRNTGRKTRDGIPVKRWKYKTDKTKRTYEGVVAQDVEKARPDAVIEDPFSGVLAVDYGKIDAPFAEVRAMLKEAA